MEEEIFMGETAYRDFSGMATDLYPRVSKKEVFRLMGCIEGSGAYELAEELYEEIHMEARKKMKPAILYRFGRIPDDTPFLPPGTSVIYVICTLGKKMEEWSTEAFNEGNPIKGLMLSAIADSALFQMDRDLENVFRKICDREGIGICSRLEAPEDMPMEAQGLIYREIRAREEYPLKISSGYMLYPVKSSGIIFTLTEDKTQFKVRHECRNCKRKNCSLRK